MSSHKVQARRAGEEAFDTGVHGATREAVAEVLALNTLAEDLAAQIICRALGESRPVKSTQRQMEDVIHEMQEARHRLQLEHRARTHHTLIPTAEYAALKATGRSKDELLRKIIDENKDIYDSEAIKIDPRTECASKIESKLLSSLELDFWATFELQYRG